METLVWVKSPFPGWEVAHAGDWRLMATDGHWEAAWKCSLCKSGEAKSLEDAKHQAEKMYRAIEDPLPPVIPSCEGSQEDGQ